MDTEDPIETASQYLDAIVRRNRSPMEDWDFKPDWADQPRKHNVYPGIGAVPLPAARIALATLEESLVGQLPESNDTFTMPMLYEMLRDSYAYGGRRLAITPNDDSMALPYYPLAVWSRGTASGGGLYPLEIYWVSGPSGPTLPGVYNYSPAQHGVQRLLIGDATGQVRRAIAPAETASDQFLLVTVKFWKNSFKYRSFSYHAVTMDVGTALGTWQLWSRAAGVPLRPLFTFDEEALNRLLGVRTHEESVFAVVPLPCGKNPPSTVRHGAVPELRVAAVPMERSRTVVRHPIVERVHDSTVTVQVADRPPAEQLAAARPRHDDGGGNDAIALAEPCPLRTTVRDALRRRRSSFGRFSAHDGLGQAELGAVLRAGTLGARLVSDVKHPDGTPELTRLAVFANHVDGVAPDVYDYSVATNTLTPLGVGVSTSFLQRTYFLNNYNMEQVAAVVTVLARPHAVLAATGQRGYRVLNAEVGAAAQAMYLAAAAIGIGCGAALGFDNVSYVEHIDSQNDPDRDGDNQEWPLLIIMLGHERRNAPDFHFRLS
ncbi:SagB family peptide dehydrogenase [Virgisporangium aurantiacum]|uniref:NADH oxidase n=1 Tax=Virgisporangium aurantiacum TaxID=175570 RepID=A0A8J3ZKF6_9ACTN|nr:SagB family peptide dehydrogenase [Virgisporangium aurantiacum]GIJ64443.1 NADH oxidase [Virgisporangium aurantiacum]